jgi:hypothetical protein
MEVLQSSKTLVYRLPKLYLRRQKIYVLDSIHYTTEATVWCRQRGLDVDFNKWRTVPHFILPNVTVAFRRLF